MALREDIASTAVSPEEKVTEEECQLDAEDLEDARAETPAEPEKQPFWKRIGPGLITGAADDDPSGIGTYSIAGAQFGNLLLWMVPFSIPLMVGVQATCGRIAAITGKGLATLLKEHYSAWVLWGAVALLFIANVINVWADLNVMAASLSMLWGHPLGLWLAVIVIVTIAMIVLLPYRIYVRYFKWLCLSLLAYVVTALLPSVHNNWGEIARSLVVPHWQSNAAFVTTVVGFLGTTISPYLFFWQPAETIEDEVAAGTADGCEAGRVKRVTDQEIKLIDVDTTTGMGFSQLICFFIMICTAATLHARGITNIETAQDAAKALLPLGKSAYWLFTLGMVGVGMLAVPTLAGSSAYALAEVVGWNRGLYRRFRRAPQFYAAIAATVVAGYALNFVHGISPVKGLLYAAVINGVAAPPLIVLILLIANNRKVIGERPNPTWLNVLGWTCAVLMAAAAILMTWAMATGKS